MCSGAHARRAPEAGLHPRRRPPTCGACSCGSTRPSMPSVKHVVLPLPLCAWAIRLRNGGRRIMGSVWACGRTRRGGGGSSVGRQGGRARRDTCRPAHSTSHRAWVLHATAKHWHPPAPAQPCDHTSAQPTTRRRQGGAPGCATAARTSSLCKAPAAAPGSAPAPQTSWLQQARGVAGQAVQGGDRGVGCVGGHRQDATEGCTRCGPPPSSQPRPALSAATPRPHQRCRKTRRLPPPSSPPRGSRPPGFLGVWVVCVGVWVGGWWGGWVGGGGGGRARWMVGGGRTQGDSPPGVAAAAWPRQAGRLRLR